MRLPTAVNSTNVYLYVLKDKPRYGLLHNKRNGGKKSRALPNCAEHNCIRYGNFWKLHGATFLGIGV